MIASGSKLLLAAVFLLGTVAAVYVPGQPGAAWSKEELLTVKAKLYRIFKYSRKAPTVLRLGFHDCLRYADGTGGCDGCLNWDGVGVKFDVHPLTQKTQPNVGETNNNNLEGVVEELEKVYKETNYPWNSPKLDKSLYETGKSRADLWAYAATVAVEFGIEWVNIACKNRTDERISRLTCIHDEGPNCEVKLPRPFKFQYGRSDCTEHDPVKTYIATKKEHHPSPLSNGPTTADFFKAEFDFSGRETVAIMGAHTYGRMNFDKSLFPYMWTSSGEDLFNNDYYKMIVDKERWYYDSQTCTKLGDAYGKKPKTRWMAHARQATHRGGPVFWIMESSVCPNKELPQFMSTFDWKCLNDAPAGMTCTADPPAGQSRPRKIDEIDGNGNRGCERYRFIIGRDEMVLNSDMGLYKNFKVKDGVIYGCPGLEHFEDKMKNTKWVVWSELPGKGKAEPLCEKETYAVPAGSEPLHTIMEEFAADQNKWISDYQKAHEKMLRNGVKTTLTDAPDHFTGVTCDIPLEHDSSKCYTKNPPVKGPSFMVKSRNDKNVGLVLTVNPKNDAATFEAENSTPFQKWKFSMSGKQLINEGTGKPLFVSGVSTFNFEMEASGDFSIVDKVSNKAVDAWNAKFMVLWHRHGFAWQKFYIVNDIPTTGPTFLIGNRMNKNAGLALQADLVKDSASFFTEDQSSLFQRWKMSESGTQLINMGTGRPLTAWGTSSFEFAPNGDDFWLLDPASGKAADAYNARDGHPVIMWTKHGLPWQKFYMINFS